MYLTVLNPSTIRSQEELTDKNWSVFLFENFRVEFVQKKFYDGRSSNFSGIFAILMDV